MGGFCQLGKLKTVRATISNMRFSYQVAGKTRTQSFSFIFPLRASKVIVLSKLAHFIAQIASPRRSHVTEAAARCGKFFSSLSSDTRVQMHTYIWVSFCRAGKMAVFCHFFFKVAPSCGQTVKDRHDFQLTLANWVWGILKTP